jgi:phospholipid/cholesterol/gamma-HCH transport system substrate-binding protein
VFPRAIRALDRSQPVISYARLYTPDLAGWFTKFAEVAGYYDANGHYARVMPVFSPARRGAGNTLEFLNPQQRTEGFERGILRHCPGSAVQPPPDGSAPRAADGCDPDDTPPGP